MRFAADGRCLTSGNLGWLLRISPNSLVENNCIDCAAMNVLVSNLKPPGISKGRFDAALRSPGPEKSSIPRSGATASRPSIDACVPGSPEGMLRKRLFSCSVMGMVCCACLMMHRAFLARSGLQTPGRADRNRFAPCAMPHPVPRAMPRIFAANRGQEAPGVQFASAASDGTVLLTDQGLPGGCAPAPAAGGAWRCNYYMHGRNWGGKPTARWLRKRIIFAETIPASGMPVCRSARWRERSRCCPGSIGWSTAMAGTSSTTWSFRPEVR